MQPLYDTAYLTLYNISFTSLPILLYSLVEQHVTMETLKRDPSLYRYDETFYKSEVVFLAPCVCDAPVAFTQHFSPLRTDIRDIAKNSLLRWPVFMYWTCLGVFDAVIFFFGAYFLFDNTTFTSNGQVSVWESWDGDADRSAVRCV